MTKRRMMASKSKSTTCAQMIPMTASCSLMQRLFLPDDAVWLPRAADRGIICDQALAVQVVQAVIHQHHSFLAAHLDGVFHLMQLVFANEVAHRAVRNKQFISENASGAVR